MHTKQTSTRRLLARAAAGLALGLGMAAAANAASIPVKHARGETAVPANPTKTVVLDLAVLDTLHTLGVDVTGVPAAAKLPPQLEQYADKRYLKVGSMFEPNYEVIHAAAPSDLRGRPFRAQIRRAVQAGAHRGPDGRRQGPGG